MRYNFKPGDDVKLKATGVGGRFDEGTIVKGIILRTQKTERDTDGWIVMVEEGFFFFEDSDGTVRGVDGEIFANLVEEKDDE